MKATIEKQCVDHARRVRAAFPRAIDCPPLALCRRLRNLERTLRTLTTDRANGAICAAAFDREAAAAMATVWRLLGDTQEVRAVVFLNSDPRGEALQVRPEARGTLPGNMGGCGILAPEFH